MNLHPLINEFQIRAPQPSPDFYTYFTGSKFRKEPREISPRLGLLSDLDLDEKNVTFVDLHTAPEQDHFEFIPVFEALESAGTTFRMVDLGAGYGLWCIHAAHLARRKGIPFHLTMVEAEPRHMRLLRQALVDNDIDESCCDLYEAAVESGETHVLVGGEKSIPFLVRQPTGADASSATPWFGQSTMVGARMLCRDAAKTGEMYFDRDVYATKDGWGFIYQPVIDLKTILERSGRVDLLIMDIQGSELAVTEKNIKNISRCVSRVSIGTHGADMEEGLRDIFREAGWEKLLDFTHGRTHATGIGEVSFGDGLLYYRNPRLKTGKENSVFFLPRIPDDGIREENTNADVAGMAAPFWEKSGEELASQWRRHFQAPEDAFKRDAGVCLVKSASQQDCVALPRIAAPAREATAGRLRLDFVFPGDWQEKINWYIRLFDGNYNLLDDFVIRHSGGDEGKGEIPIGKSSMLSRPVSELILALYPREPGAWHLLPTEMRAAFCGNGA